MPDEDFESTTNVIPREVLAGLLDTIVPIDKQRITAKIAAATVDPGPEPSRVPTLSGVVIKFKTPTAPTAATRVPRPRAVVVAISFAVTLVVGSAIMFW